MTLISAHTELLIQGKVWGELSGYQNNYRGIFIELLCEFHKSGS